MNSTTGRLTVIATPIGNLDDLSPRARAELLAADRILCEDTRRTGRLMAHIGVKKPLLSLHEHNERRRVDQVLEALLAGEHLALVSDAGTPLLSDPGFLVVRAASTAGLPITTVPGPSAALAALVVSGLPPLPYTFVGFPPAKPGKRRRFFERYREFDHTLILFESPHRIVRSLRDAHEVLGDRRIAVARELTKLHEETLRGRISDVVDLLAAKERVKGELVVVVGSAEVGDLEPRNPRSDSDG